MASITLCRKGVFRAQLHVCGRRESKTFTDRSEAEAWAERREIEISGYLPTVPKILILDLDELVKLGGVSIKDTHCGVYFLWDCRRKLAYIGQSRNVFKRVERHKVEPPAVWQYSTSVPIEFPWQLSVEQLYIAKYGQPSRDPDALNNITSRIESYVPNKRSVRDAQEDLRAKGIDPFE